MITVGVAKATLACLLIAFISHATPSAAAVITSSTFDVDADGWLVTTNVGGNFAPDYQSTGGNPNGHISEVDPDNGTFYFAAPSKFEGDISTTFGGTLAFDLAIEFLTSTGVITPLGITDVFIRSSGQTLFVRNLAPPSELPAYTTFSLVLDESEGWLRESDSLAASNGEILAVLQDVTSLEIRGEYISGPDRSHLDNVFLTMAAIPEPATLAVFVVGLVGIGVARHKQHSNHRTRR